LEGEIRWVRGLNTLGPMAQATQVWSKMRNSTISTLDLIANILSTKTVLSYIADCVCVQAHGANSRNFLYLTFNFSSKSHFGSIHKRVACQVFIRKRPIAALLCREGGTG